MKCNQCDKDATEMLGNEPRCFIHNQRVMSYDYNTALAVEPDGDTSLQDHTTGLSFSVNKAFQVQTSAIMWKCYNCQQTTCVCPPPPKVSQLGTYEVDSEIWKALASPKQKLRKYLMRLQSEDELQFHTETIRNYIKEELPEWADEFEKMLVLL